MCAPATSLHYFSILVLLLSSKVLQNDESTESAKNAESVTSDKNTENSENTENAKLHHLTFQTIVCKAKFFLLLILAGSQHAAIPTRS
jgi:hypothetical protein